jgi:hypothetical protein
MPQFAVTGPGIPIEPTPPGAGVDIQALLDQKADEYGVPRNLVRTVARIESNFRPSAFSSKGAVGPMQLMPATAKALGVTDINDPTQNIDAGVRLLAQLSNQYGGDTRHILAGYNAGQPAVDRAGGVPNYPETKAYVAKGMQELPGNVATPQAAGGDAISRILAGEDVELTPDVIRQIMAGPQPATPSAAQPTPAAKPEPAATTPPKQPFQIVGEGVPLDAKPQYNYPKPTYKSPLPWPLNNLDEAVNDSIEYMADGLMRAYKASTVDEKLAGLSETIHGFFNAPAAPFLLQAAGTAPVRTAIQLGVGVGLQKGVEKGAEALGAGPGTSAFSGDIAGLTAAMLTGRFGKGGGEGPSPAPPGGPRGGGAPPPGGPGLDFLDNPGVRTALKIHPKGALLLKLYDAAKWVQGNLRGSQPEQPSPSPPQPPAARAPNVPVTAPTDDALLRLSFLEKDPAKLQAIQEEMVRRGMRRAPVEPAAPAEPSAVAPEQNPYRDYSQKALQDTYAVETNPQKRALMEQAARDRNLSLFTRETRRATATVPETGFVEPSGPSLTQDDALMLRHLGIEDPLSADPESIAIARKFVAENPDLVKQLRTGTPETSAAPAAAPEQAPAAEAPAPAAAPPAEAPATVPPGAAGTTPGQALAESKGLDWQRLKGQEKAFLEQAAAAQQNFAEQQLELVTRPTPAERTTIAQPPAATAAAASEVPTLEYNAPQATAPAEAPPAAFTATDAARLQELEGRPTRELTMPEWNEKLSLLRRRREAGLTTAAPEAELLGSVSEKGVPVQEGETPPQAQAAFEQAQRTQGRRKKAQPAEAPPAEAAAPAAPQNLAELMQGKTQEEIGQSLADLMQESGTAPPAAPAGERPAAVTQSQKRVEAFAQHFAGDETYTPEMVDALQTNPRAKRLLESLGRSLDIEGRPTAEELPRIADRVREIRGQKTPPEAPGGAPPVSATPAISIEKTTTPAEAQAAFQEAASTFSTSAVEKLIKAETKKLRAEGDLIPTSNPAYSVSQPDGSVLRVRQLRTPKGTLVFHSTDGETWRIVNDPRPDLEAARHLRQ